MQQFVVCEAELLDDPACQLFFAGTGRISPILSGAIKDYGFIRPAFALFQHIRRCVVVMLDRGLASLHL
jgi:hypothetical protein